MAALCSIWAAKTVSFRIAPASLSKASVTVSSQTYNGKAKTPAPTVKLNGKTLAKGTDYTVTYRNNVNAGTASAVIAGKGNYTGSVTKPFAIAKAAQPMIVKADNKTYKVKKLKKKARTYQAVKVIKNQGKVTYKASYKNKKSKKALKFNAKTGKLKVKKGTKKGTYRVTVTVRTAGNANYKAGSVTKTITVKVKK